MHPTPEDQSNVPVATPLQDDSPARLDPFKPGPVACLIALFLFALYPGVFLGMQSFFLRDFGVFTYPVAYYAHESFWHGQVPLWNPLNNCGVPFLAQWNTSVCYPPSLIYLLFPLPWSLNYFCLGHLMFAGVGMYLLAYRWTQDRLSASIAGVVFALNGLMLNCLMWTSNLAALSWQPLVVLWVEQAWRQGGRRTVIAAMAGAMQMLSGAPEIIVFTWAILGMLWLGQAWQRVIPLWPAGRRLAVIGLLVTGLSAIQLLPFFDFLKHSQRDSSYMGADAWPMPPWGWANFLVPVFRCVRTSFGPWLQAGQPWTSSYYLGVGTLALAGVAVWRLRRRWEVYGLAGVTLASLVLALGDAGHVYVWLKHVAPWIGFARFPIKFVSMAVFTIPLLAAAGFKVLQKTNPPDRENNPCDLLLAAAFLWLMIVITLATARWLPLPGYRWQPAWADGAFRALFLAAVVGMVIVWIHISMARMRGLMGLALLALMGFDLVTSGSHANAVITTRAFGPLELNMSARPKYGESRALVGRQATSYLLYGSTDDPLYYYVGQRGALFENCNIPENIPKVDGFCSLHLKGEWNIDGMFYGAYLDQTFEQAQTNPPPAAPLLDFLGVSQVSAPRTIFAWQERKTFLPMATAGQRPIFADDAETLEKLNSDSFDPRHTVYLPWSARSKIAVTGASDAKIIFQRFEAQQAYLTIQTPAPALVVVAQVFYHDWRAYVDGKSVPVLRANHTFQAVEIPAGRHEIVLRYEDWMFRLGALISALTSLGCLAGLLPKPRR